MFAAQVLASGSSQVRQLVGELEEPGPAVRALEGAGLGAGEVVGLPFEAGLGEVVAEDGPDLGGLGKVGEAAGEPGEHPVAVDRGVPVVAAEERRVERPGALDVGRPGHDVVELVGIFLAHPLERQAGEAGGLLAGQAGGRSGPVGREGEGGDRHGQGRPEGPGRQGLESRRRIREHRPHGRVSCRLPDGSLRAAIVARPRPRSKGPVAMKSEGKAAIVTGAGSGIGRATALALLLGRLRRGPGRPAARRPRRDRQAGRRRGEPGPGRPDRRDRPRLRLRPVPGHHRAVRAGRPPLQQRRDRGARGPARRPAAGGLAAGARRQRDRVVPLHPGSVPGDEGPGPPRRPDHQQRLDLGARPPAPLGRLHREQARDHRPDPVGRPRRPGVRHRLRPGRRRQRRHRDGRPDEGRDPPGRRHRRASSRRSTPRTSPPPCSRWPASRWRPTSSS